MNGGTVFLAGVVAVGGYMGYSMMNHDPMVVDLPVAEVQAQLARAVTTWPSEESNLGGGVGSIMPAGSFSGGVNVKLRYSSQAGARDCKILLTAVDNDTTRMASDCSDGDVTTASASSALQRADDETDEVFIDEHARSVMAGDTFDFEGADRLSTDIMLRERSSITAEAMEGER